MLYILCTLIISIVSIHILDLEYKVPHWKSLIIATRMLMAWSWLRSVTGKMTKTGIHFQENKILFKDIYRFNGNSISQFFFHKQNILVYIHWDKQNWLYYIYNRTVSPELYVQNKATIIYIMTKFWFQISEPWEIILQRIHH